MLLIGVIATDRYKLSKPMKLNYYSAPAGTRSEQAGLLGWGGLSAFEVLGWIGNASDQLQKKSRKEAEAAGQPEPFTPGISKDLVCKHAQKLREQRLLDHDPLTPQDWLLAERDLIEELQKGGV